MRLLLQDIQWKFSGETPNNLIGRSADRYQESASQTIVFNDDDPNALGYLLEYLYTKPEHMPYYELSDFSFEDLKARSNILIIADNYGVSALVEEARHCVEYFMNLLDDLKNGSERAKSLNYIVKAVFGPEACPGFDCAQLKECVTLQACKQFKTTPSLRDDILQLMGEHADLRKRMTEMSLLTNNVKDVEVVKWMRPLLVRTTTDE
jgi:hypothetical protein